MNDIEIINKIERYWNNEMPFDEKRAFQVELLTNPELKADFESWLLMKQTAETIKQRETMQALRKRIEKKEEDVQQPVEERTTPVVAMNDNTAKVVRLFPLRRVLAIAASFLGIIIVAYHQEDIKRFIEGNDMVEVKKDSSPVNNGVPPLKEEVVIAPKKEDIVIKDISKKEKDTPKEDIVVVPKTEEPQKNSSNELDWSKLRSYNPDTYASNDASNNNSDITVERGNEAKIENPLEYLREQYKNEKDGTNRKDWLALLLTNYDKDFKDASQEELIKKILNNPKHLYYKKLKSVIKTKSDLK